MAGDPEQNNGHSCLLLLRLLFECHSLFDLVYTVRYCKLQQSYQQQHQQFDLVRILLLYFQIAFQHTKLALSMSLDGCCVRSTLF